MTKREEFERKAANGEILIKYLGVHVSVATRQNYIEEKRTETGYSSDYLNTGYEVFCAAWEASKAQVVPEGYTLVSTELLDKFPEINMSNYGQDEVDALNSWGIEVVTAAAPVKDGA